MAPSRSRLNTGVSEIRPRGSPIPRRDLLVAEKSRRRLFRRGRAATLAGTDHNDWLEQQHVLRDVWVVGPWVPRDRLEMVLGPGSSAPARGSPRTNAPGQGRTSAAPGVTPEARAPKIVQSSSYRPDRAAMAPPPPRSAREHEPSSRSTFATGGCPHPPVRGMDVDVPARTAQWWIAYAGATFNP